MPEAIQRGSVVLRGGLYGVVWDVRGAEMVLLPIARCTGQHLAHDVELDFANLLGGGIALPDARVQAGSPVQTDSDGQARTGALHGATLCRIVAAVARAYAAARVEQVWADERRHRHEAASVRVVRL